MFNQRPTTLPGLDLDSDGSKFMSLFSPVLPSPDDCMKYIDYIFSRGSESLNTPTTIPIGHFHQQQLQQHQIQQHQHQQQQLQHHQHQQQQNQQQHHQHLGQQQQQQQHQQQHISLPNNQQPSLAHMSQDAHNLMQSNSYDIPRTSQANFNTFNVQSGITATAAGQPALTGLASALKQEPDSVQLGQTIQGQVIKPAETPKVATQVGPSKPRLTDEERIRNKRERNRKAAANCRRRKDEKLHKLEEENRKKDEKMRELADENNELRLTIESLQAELAALKAGKK